VFELGKLLFTCIKRRKKNYKINVLKMWKHKNQDKIWILTFSVESIFVKKVSCVIDFDDVNVIDDVL